MAWVIEISNQAKKSLKQLDPQAAKRVLNFLFERVAMLDDPRAIGEPLRGAKLGEYWKYRVGDYRIIAQLKDGVLQVVVMQIGHRKEIYK
jgi:mRNA interferase RelE/StbE